MNNIYTFTVPIFIKHLGSLKDILRKAEDFAIEKKLNPAELLEDKLAPDMFSLIQQVQIACDNAKGAAARLSGMEPPKHEDNEKTFVELYARIDKTVEYLKSFTMGSFDDATERRVTLIYFPGKDMSGLDYVTEFAIPNFFFHVVTAYGIIRKNGVIIGKADFIAGMSLKDIQSTK